MKYLSSYLYITDSSAFVMLGLDACTEPIGLQVYSGKTRSADSKVKTSSGGTTITVVSPP
jgi:hypothetical protein